jgi:hypothetical protein
MRILIIAVNHQIQPAQIKSMSPDGKLEDFEHGQKEKLGELVREHVRMRGVQFVGEEARHGLTASANMTPGPKGKCATSLLVITRTLVSRKLIKIRYNREREEHMAKRVHAENGKADSVIAICGRVHAEAIADRLSQLGHTVDILDLRSQPWYIDDWQSHMLQL